MKAVRGNFQTRYQTHLLQALLSSSASKTFTIQGMSSTKLVEGGPLFLSTCYKQSSYISTSPQMAHEQSIGRFRDSLLHHTKDLEKPSSHVSAKQNMSTSVEATILCTTCCLYQSCMGTGRWIWDFTSDRLSDECIFHDSEVANIQNSRISEAEIQGRINNMEYTAKK